MNLFTRALCLLLTATLLSSGCTYHSKIRRNLFKEPDRSERIPASVMVVSDRFLTKELHKADTTRIVDYDIFIRAADGTAVAVADALGTLFTDVEVNKYEFRKNYDYIAEVEFAIDEGAEERYRDIWEFTRFGHFYGIRRENFVYPWIQTELKVTIRNPKTRHAIAQYQTASQKTYFRNNTLTVSTHFLSLLTLGLFSPVEIQARGNQYRKMLETQLRAQLSQVISNMEEDRDNYFPLYNTETEIYRVDGKFEPFMKAVTWIECSTLNGGGRGSGFFISPDGYMLTNAHVVDECRDLRIMLYGEDFENPKPRFAKVIKQNKRRDIALLKVEGENFPWLELEPDRSKYVTGEKVFALGQSNGDLHWTYTQGVLSRTFNENGHFLLQTDTAITNGNSGGPLLLLSTGKVVGINSAGYQKLDSAGVLQDIAGMNIAISSYEVQKTLKISQPLGAKDFEALLEDEE